MLASTIAITLVIHFADLAGAPPSVVGDAKHAVEDILRDIDVTVTWAETPDARHGASNVVRLTMVPYEGGTLRSRDGAVMGAATRTALGTGVAWVYYQRVREEANRHAVPLARLLACVMAHEIGHVVLAAPGHESAGLMRAAWNTADFHRASAGRLRFAAAVRRRLRTST